MAEHTCPWWLGYLLASPLRKLIQDPKTILQPFIKEGMTVLDVGSAMGFFSLPMAEMVGPGGKLICVDLQEKMISNLKKRLIKAGLAEQTETRVCPKDSLGIDDLAGKVDFALAFALVHEVPDQEGLFRQIHTVLKPDHMLLVSEPAGHVNLKSFEKTIKLAQEVGFSLGDVPIIKRGHSRLLIKK